LNPGILRIATGIGLGAAAGFTAAVGLGTLAAILLGALGHGRLVVIVLFWTCLAGLIGGGAAGGITAYRRGSGPD
jgi:hypothetical protein